MPTFAVACAIGLGAGILGGMAGVGGAVVMIPAMVFFLGFSQKLAQGTALAAMIPPIGLLAAWEYYRSGFVNIPVAAGIALGFIVGGLLGGWAAVHIDEVVLRRVFGLILLLVSIEMLVR